MIRANTKPESLTFGDTDYLLSYNAFPETIANISNIWVRAPFSLGELIDQPKNGTSYKKLGIEVMVEDIGSDNISLFIKIKIKPVIENYMLVTYNYTRVDIPLSDSKTVNINGLSTDKTNQYTFRYAFAPSSDAMGATLIVETLSQSKQYSAYPDLEIYEAGSDFGIEIRLYKADTDYMVLYVKPLY